MQLPSQLNTDIEQPEQLLRLNSSSFASSTPGNNISSIMGQGNMIRFEQFTAMATGGSTTKKDIKKSGTGMGTTAMGVTATTAPFISTTKKHLTIQIDQCLYDNNEFAVEQQPQLVAVDEQDIETLNNSQNYQSTQSLKIIQQKISKQQQQQQQQQRYIHNHKSQNSYDDDRESEQLQQSEQPVDEYYLRNYQKNQQEEKNNNIDSQWQIKQKRQQKRQQKNKIPPISLSLNCLDFQSEQQQQQQIRKSKGTKVKSRQQQQSTAATNKMIENLSNKVKDLQKTIVSQNRQNSLLNSQLNFMKQMLEKEQTERMTQNAKAQQMQAKMVDQVSLIAKVQQMEGKLAEYKQLQQQNKALEQKLREKDTKVHQLQKKIDKVTKMNRAFQNELKDSDKRICQLQKDNQKLTCQSHHDNLARIKQHSLRSGGHMKEASLKLSKDGINNKENIHTASNNMLHHQQHSHVRKSLDKKKTATTVSQGKKKVAVNGGATTGTGGAGSTFSGLSGTMRGLRVSSSSNIVNKKLAMTNNHHRYRD